MTPPVGKFLFILCALSLSISATIIFTISLIVEDILLFTIITLIVLLTLPSFMQKMSGKPIDLFVPPVFLSVVLFLGHILPIPSFLAGEDPFSILWGYPFRSQHDALLRALLLIILGASGFYFGYGVFALRPVKYRSLIVAWNVYRLSLIGIIYTLLGFGLFVVGVVLVGGPSVLITGLADRTRAFAGLGYFFNGILLLLSFSLLWWTYLLRKHCLNNWYFWIYTLFSLLSSGFIGSRANAFIAILAGIVLYHRLYNPIPFRLLLILGGFGAISLVGYALFFREFLITGQLGTLETYSDRPNPLWLLFAQMLSGEFMHIQILSTLIEAMPSQIPFQNGATYLFLLATPIPSSLWPEKPLPAPGIFTLALWPERWLLGGTTIPPTLIGEMYMNFGTLGVFICMILFGALYRIVYARSVATTCASAPIILYALMLAGIVHYVRGAFPEVTAVLLIFILPTLLALRFVEHRYSTRNCLRT
jgi:oligosaccharide repeat unit polymerase